MANTKGEKIKFSTRVNKVNQFLGANSSSINFIDLWIGKVSNMYNRISLQNSVSVFGGRRFKKWLGEEIRSGKS